jgi:glycosyltransferase involved in cell wall biosynthesis
MTSLSVCIPTYNRPKELGNLLESIAPGVKVNVSDNGGLLTEEFRNRFPSVIFKSAGSPPIAMFPNWNRAARMADTDWLVIPSDDDIYYPDSFDEILGALAKNPSAGIVVFGHHVVGESYEVLDTWQPDAGVMRAPDGFERFKFGVGARMPSVAIRRSAMEQLGYLDEHYACTAADSDFVQRALLSFDSAFVPAVVSGYRVWQRGATSLTLATPVWLEEIDYWGAKIEVLLRGIPKYSREATKVHEELYATNLLAGLHLLRTQGKAEQCRAHFRQSRYPRGARLATQLRILSQIARATRK